MSRAAVRILHVEPADDAGELTRLLARARATAAGDIGSRFAAVGAQDVRIVTIRSDGRSFGERLRALAAETASGGLVVLGSGSIPLATDGHLRTLVATAASGEPVAVTNNRYSSDAIAVGDARRLASVPDIPGDNVLPRWLETHADVVVEELGDRTLLAMDIDSPLDVELVRRHPACPAPLRALARSMADRWTFVAQTLDALHRVAADRRRELLVAGRVSARTLLELESTAACRVRALVEERGLRASWPLPDEQPAGPGREDDDLGPPESRSPGSVLGMLLDRDGADRIGTLVSELADGALIDTRVLIAHRMGADEAAWPTPEDRFASDLLLADRVRDPWLRTLTLAAGSHALPIALGGHTLVGPGLRLALGVAP